MHYHIILTENCNLRCRYCYEKSMAEFDNGLDKKFDFDFSDPEDSIVSVDELRTFLSKDDDPVLIFYGGEPLMKIDKIVKIMDGLSDMKIRYRMQSNGVLLKNLPIEYLKKIDKILISLDGDCERTEFNRGIGTYDAVIDGLKWARNNGYDGEIVARMTIAQEFPDLFEQVIHLVGLIDEGVFNSVHWQLDVGFYKEDYEFNKIRNFFDKYNESINRLIDWWIGEISEGKVYRLYPFVGIVKPLLDGIKNCGLRCGAGFAGYAIGTGGKVVHCPIMNNIENFKAGDLKSDVKDLKKFDCKDECGDCEVFGLCGGRCMYWRKSDLWPKDGNDMICESIKFYIGKIRLVMDKIKELIKKGVICREDFEYEDYFGPEIIP